MKRITQTLLFCSLLTLTSCFEIVEQVFIKNDGSGNFQLVLNMSKSKTRLNSIMQMKTVNGHDVPSKADISKRIADLAAIVKQTVGISNVKTNLDFDNYIASFTCDFTKITGLNAAVKNIGLKENTQSKAIEKSYEYNPAAGIFSRLNKYSLKNDYDKMTNADKEVFANAGYTAIYRFEKTVLNSSNPDSKVASSKKAVMMKLNALDIIRNKKSIENNITLIK